MDLTQKLDLGWEALAKSGWEAYCAAFSALFPTATPPLPDEAALAALAEQTKKLLLQGDALENRKFRGLAIEFYTGFRAAIGVPPGDPSPEVILPWEALVRHLAEFLEADDGEDAAGLMDGVAKWRAWALRQIQAAPVA